MRAGIRRGEFVGEGLTGLDRRLRDERHAILIIRNLDPVKVNRGRLRKLILENESHPVALAHPYLGTRDLVIVGPGFDGLSRSGFPTNYSRCQLVDLYATLETRLEKLIAFPCRLGGKSFDAHLVHLVHCFRCCSGGNRRGIRRHCPTAVVGVRDLACLCGRIVRARGDNAPRNRG